MDISFPQRAVLSETPRVRFARVTLAAPAGRLQAVVDFYGERLGLRRDGASLAVGETSLEFVSGAGEPFYHFALLVPGNRFEAALEWARARTELLPWPDSDEVVFDFDNWSAKACYFHDPAGNIVELVAHRGIGENGARGEFRADELVGLSELGLVGDQRAMAATLGDELGLAVWDGTLDEPGALAFVGEKGRTLILAPPGRGWLPTGRPAERHEVEAVLADAAQGDAALEDGRYRIRG
jgi:catechol 2,3-dioxygenase-like lactoylglutathione lyase family enzyme